MNKYRRFYEFITLQTLIVSIIAILSTLLCLKFGMEAKIPTGLLVAVIFPIVFAINAAFRRRESSLTWLADMKGATMSLFFTYRDWVQAPSNEAGKEILKDGIQRLKTNMEMVANYLSDQTRGKRERLTEIYGEFSGLSLQMEKARQAGLAGGEVSRANQYLSHIMRDFEKLSTIKEYRTPLSLRGYWQIFLNLFPILFSPFFASLAIEVAGKTNGVQNPINNFGYIVAFGTAILYTLVLVGLDNIQEKLESPFDADSIDDIRLDFASVYAQCMDSLTSK